MGRAKEERSLSGSMEIDNLPKTISKITQNIVLSKLLNI